MKHLVSYRLFEKSTSTSGTTPKIDVDAIAPATGKRVNPDAKDKVESYMGGWFQSLGDTIEKLGGDLIKDPSKWKDDYKKELPGYTVTSAGGKTTKMRTDAGFSDIVGLGVSATKGILSKMFGGPSEAPPIDEANPDITPEHQRIFVSKNRDELAHYKSQDDVNKWAINKYKDAGLKPGENQGFDRSIQASEFDWLSGSGGSSAISGAGEAVTGVEAAEGGAGLGELAELALVL